MIKIIKINQDYGITIINTINHNNPQLSSKSLKNSQISTNETNNSNIKLKCKYCNKLCSRSDNLNRHELKCKVKLSNEAKLKEENELLKNELNNFKNDMMEMQKKLISKKQNLSRYNTIYRRFYQRYL